MPSVEGRTWLQKAMQLHASIIDDVDEVGARTMAGSWADECPSLTKALKRLKGGLTKAQAADMAQLDQLDADLDAADLAEEELVVVECELNADGDVDE